MKTQSLPTAGAFPSGPPGCAPVKPNVSGRFVPLTHHEIRVLSPWAMAVLVHLRYLSMGTENEISIGYQELQVALGWSDDGASTAALDKLLERAVGELEARDLVIKTRRSFTRGTTAPIYQVVARPRGSRFEQLPLELVRQLLSPAFGKRGAVLLRTWAAIRLLCGADGSAVISRQELASVLHCNADRAAQQRRELVALGVLFEHERAGRASLTSTSPIPAQTDPGAVPVNDAISEVVATTDVAPDEVLPTATGPRPDLSGGPVLDCRVAPSSDVGSYKETDPYETEKDLGLGPQDRDGELTREAAAAVPPSQPHDQAPQHEPAPGKLSTDQFAVAARTFVAGCPQTRDLPGKTRGQLRQWLAGQLRTLPETDLDKILTLLAFELDLMTELRDGRPFNHRAAMGQVLDRLRLDALIGPDPEPVPETGMPDWYDRGEGLEGPDLETLAADTPASSGGQDDPNTLLQRCTTTLAGCLLDELETDPTQNIEDALDRARSRARVLLDLTGGGAAILIVARGAVREAWKVSWRNLHDSGKLATEPTSPDEIAQLELGRQQCLALIAHRELQAA